MMFSEQKKHEYWNHFIAELYISNQKAQFTGTHLRKIKPLMWRDHDFWYDLLVRHSGNDMTPEQMRDSMRGLYDHAHGNFWGMIIQKMVENGIVKS